MSTRATGLRLVLPLLLACACTAASLAQGGIDLSVHFSPQLRYVNSVTNGRELAPGATVGGQGLAIGYGFGGAIEFRLVDELYLRTGVDFVHKRQQYRVALLGNDIMPSTSRSNLVTYQALAVPLQVFYRFGFHHDKANFLVGLGVTALQFVGDPKVEAPLSNKDLTGFESVVTTRRSVSLFMGYDRFVSDRFVVSLEPYLTYVPDRINLESHTTARVITEAGIRLRLTLVD